MTTDKKLKQAAHQLVADQQAAGTPISYTEALYRLDPDRAERQAGTPGIFNGKAAGVASTLTWAKLNGYLDETEAHLKDDDPYRRAAAFQQRAFLYNELAAHTTDPTYKAACYRAAICDETSAARIRFEHGIPTVRPKTEAHLLGLKTCHSCGRSWQISEEGVCPDCPHLKFGHTPSSRADAKRWAAQRMLPEPEDPMYPNERDDPDRDWLGDPYLTDEQSAAGAERYNGRDIPGLTWASDEDGEARYERQAADDLPPEPCPHCACCNKFDCLIASPDCEHGCQCRKGTSDPEAAGYGLTPAARALVDSRLRFPAPAPQIHTSNPSDPFNLRDPGYYGRPVDDPDGESAALAQEHADERDFHSGHVHLAVPTLGPRCPGCGHLEAQHPNGSCTVCHCDSGAEYNYVSPDSDED